MEAVRPSKLAAAQVLHIAGVLSALSAADAAHSLDLNSPDVEHGTAQSSSLRVNNMALEDT